MREIIAQVAQNCPQSVSTPYGPALRAAVAGRRESAARRAAGMRDCKSSGLSKRRTLRRFGRGARGTGGLKVDGEMDPLARFKILSLGGRYQMLDRLEAKRPGVYTDL